MAMRSISALLTLSAELIFDRLVEHAHQPSSTTDDPQKQQAQVVGGGALFQDEAGEVRMRTEADTIQTNTQQVAGCQYLSELTSDLISFYCRACREAVPNDT